VAERVRRSPIAGRWYPGDAATLVHEVDAYLGRVTGDAPPERLVALISPHAGLVYSGPVAAHGYALVRGRRDLTAVLVGPSHFVRFQGVSVFASGCWETPLGRVAIDEGIARALLAEGDEIRDEPRVHGQEHSLEMQLPFLQALVKGLRIVPVLLGSQEPSEVEMLSSALARVLEREPALLVASSDLSHYHPASVANRLDALVVGDVERFSPESLMDRLQHSDGHACGGGAMVAVMKAARSLGATRSEVLCYGDSGDVGERDKSRVVGYLSAALLASA
jgi:AmmeMemoRadiSam system protein B